MVPHTHNPGTRRQRMGDHGFETSQGKKSVKPLFLNK
jgi:hypothetical protein